MNLLTFLLTAITAVSSSTTKDQGLIGHFDGPCPDGWEYYADLAARVPVGVGGGFSLGQTGGEQRHTLTIHEMPRHSHTFDRETDRKASYISRGHIFVSHRDSNTVHTSAVGGSGSHNNMQPYRVLRPCRKITAENYAEQVDLEGTQEQLRQAQIEINALNKRLQDVMAHLGITAQPTDAPTFMTASPTISPTEDPTKYPTNAPTSSPTNAPTQSPTSQTVNPTFSPTKTNLSPRVCEGREVTSPHNLVPGSWFDYAMPGFFCDPEDDDLTIIARVKEGTDEDAIYSHLPSWLFFDPTTLHFYGFAQSSDLQDVMTEVTATDPRGKQVSASFFLKFYADRAQIPE